jgi:phosphoglycerate dehydrogenase-like enzyme
VTRVEREELFATADVVTVHLLWSKRTRGLIGADDFARMKPTSVFINTSRGPIVQQQALIDALDQNRIAGAGIDVYDQEPLPVDDPMRSLPRTVLTPHLGYVTRGTYEVFYGEAVEDVAAFLAGSPIRVITPA